MGKRFEIQSKFSPAGDQPQAIAQLVEGINDGLHSQTLLGVTGSGKTFTIANVIETVQRPTLVMAPNKTLAAQLYGESKEFFPENIMTTTSPRHMFLRQTFISKKTHQLMTILSKCGFLQQRRFWREKM